MGVISHPVVGHTLGGIKINCMIRFTIPIWQMRVKLLIFRENY